MSLTEQFYAMLRIENSSQFGAHWASQQCFSEQKYVGFIIFQQENVHLDAP